MCSASLQMFTPKRPPTLSSVPLPVRQPNNRMVPKNSWFVGVLLRHIHCGVQEEFWKIYCMPLYKAEHKHTQPVSTNGTINKQQRCKLLIVFVMMPYLELCFSKIVLEPKVNALCRHNVGDHEATEVHHRSSRDTRVCRQKAPSGSNHRNENRSDLPIIHKHKLSSICTQLSVAGESNVSLNQRCLGDVISRPLPTTSISLPYSALVHCGNKSNPNKRHVIDHLHSMAVGHREFLRLI